MTDSHVSMYDEHASTVANQIGLAAARFDIDATRLLQMAGDETGVSYQRIADLLDISREEVEQRFNGDVRTMTIVEFARIVAAMGVELSIDWWDSPGLKLVRQANQAWLEQEQP